MCCLKFLSPGVSWHDSWTNWYLSLTYHATLLLVRLLLCYSICTSLLLSRENRCDNRKSLYLWGIAKNIPFTINAIHFVLYNLITYFYVYSVQLFIEKFITHKILPCSRTSTKKQLSPYFLGITIDKICRKGYNIEEDINSFLTNYFLICAIYIYICTSKYHGYWPKSKIESYY